MVTTLYQQSLCRSQQINFGDSLGLDCYTHYTQVKLESADTEVRSQMYLPKVLKLHHAHKITTAIAQLASVEV